MNGGLHLARAVGRVANVEKAIDDRGGFKGTLGIAHTRWATHGGVTEKNAHPHRDDAKLGHGIAIIHNGIIENYSALKRYLEEKGHVFTSETDTEVLAHLIGELYQGDLEKAVQAALREVTGAYAIAVVCEKEPEVLVVARKGSPLMVGVGNGNGQNILGNDNKLPAAYARLGAGYVDDQGTDIRIGMGGRYNPRTVGTLPNLFQETDTVAFADVDVRIQGFQVTAQAIYKDVAFDTLVPDLTGESGVGATAWFTMNRPLGLDLYGLRPAYRISYFDPSSSFADDQLIENSLAVRWDVPAQALPLSLIVDGTLLTEFGEGVRDLDNARLTALLQLEL